MPVKMVVTRSAARVVTCRVWGAGAGAGGAVLRHGAPQRLRPPRPLQRPFQASDSERRPLSAQPTRPSRLARVSQLQPASTLSEFELRVPQHLINLKANTLSRWPDPSRASPCLLVRVRRRGAGYYRDQPQAEPHWHWPRAAAAVPVAAVPGPRRRLATQLKRPAEGPARGDRPGVTVGLAGTSGCQ
eukprot:539735-Rhodomonas_salina.1